MKLTDLEPKWVVVAQPGTHVGVTFLCPCCQSVRLAAMFRAAIGPAADGWERVGETFETLTLSPSIDASASGHWHGFINNGEVTP